MYPPSDLSSIPVVLDASPRRGRPLLAWLAVCSLVALVIFLSSYRPAAKLPKAKNGADLLVFQLQARYMVGAAALLGRGDPRLAEQARVLDTGPVSHRLRYAILQGELSGPEQALTSLRSLDGK